MQLVPNAKAAASRGAWQQVWPWLAATVSGVLLALCYAPFDLSWLVWFALIPLLSAIWISPLGGWRSLGLGYVTGLVFFTATFHWLRELAPLFEAPLLLGLPLLLALYLGLYVGAWAWLLSRLAVDRISSAAGNLGCGILAASAWVALEWTRGWLLTGFGWNGLGVALHRDLPLIQIADLTGVLGVSWVVAFVNVMAVLIVRRILRDLGPTFLARMRWEFSATMALLALVFGYGMRALFTPAGDEAAIRVAWVQPNVSQAEKWASAEELSAAEDAVFRKLERLTGLAAEVRSAAGSLPDLVLWPEAATPRGLHADRINFDFVTTQARGLPALLLGTIDQDVATGAVYNAAALLQAGDDEAQMHRKIHLVPFGEYLPLRESFPPLAMVAGGLIPSDLSAGTEFNLLMLTQPELRLATLICFEDTVPELATRFTRDGAKLLVNLTNDGWFGRSPGARQHLANAVFRAVENRRPLLRCGNTGVSGVVDPSGRFTQVLEPFTEGMTVREVKVAVHSPLTFYSAHGDLFAEGCAMLTAAMLAVLGIRGWQGRRTSGYRR